jgi:protein-disulfide isomerase
MGSIIGLVLLTESVGCRTAADGGSGADPDVDANVTDDASADPDDAQNPLDQDGGQEPVSNSDPSGQDSSPADSADLLVVDPGVDHFKGELNAPNVIIEYANFLCSHCRDFFGESLPDLEALVGQGQVVYVYRHVAVGESASTVAQAAECAAVQDEAAFFPYHGRIFSHTGEFTAAALRRYAADLDLDGTAFDVCLATGATADRVQRDIQSARDLGVTRRPTFFVNGQMLVGNRPVEEFEPLLE